MNRVEKESVVGELSELLSSHSVIIVLRNNGLTVSDFNSFRNNMKLVEASLRVSKNTLILLALDSSDRSSISEYIAGPTVLLFSNESAGACKALMKFAEENEDTLDVISGLIDGSVVTLGEIKTLSKLPSLAELRAKLLAAISAPGTNLARVIGAVPEGLARVLKANSEKG